MPKLPRIAVAALALTCALALGGCGAGEPEPTPAPTESEETVFESEDEALAAATEAYAAYQEMSDTILADGGSNPDRINPFAVGDARDAAISSFTTFSSDGLRTLGVSTFENVTLQSVGSPNSMSLVSIYLCLDISMVDVIDQSGASVVAPSRPDKQAYLAEFVLAEPSSTALRVSMREAWAGEGICVS